MLCTPPVISFRICPQSLSTLSPYPTLFRSYRRRGLRRTPAGRRSRLAVPWKPAVPGERPTLGPYVLSWLKRNLIRSEEHTSELQSPCNLVCLLLLEVKKFISAN